MNIIKLLSLLSILFQKLRSWFGLVILSWDEFEYIFSPPKYTIPAGMRLICSSCLSALSGTITNYSMLLTSSFYYFSSFLKSF